MLTTTITPDLIAVALGAGSPPSSDARDSQWDLWIGDALMLIQARVDTMTPEPTVEQARLDYVIREAVVAHVRRPDDATQVTINIDDASSSKTYRSSAGRVQILDEWWALLGLVPAGGGAFDLDLLACQTVHAQVCALNLGANYCSCMADIAGFPLYEGDPL